MITLLGVLVVAMFSNENATFIESVNENRDNGYKWAYVGKQDVVDYSLSLPLNDKIYFKHIKK